MIKHRYQQPTVELCRECNGEGSVYIYPEYDLLHQTDPKKKKCPICNGSGRVVVSKKIEITIVAFKQNRSV